jgi:hypothetical protein
MPIVQIFKGLSLAPVMQATQEMAPIVSILTNVQAIETIVIQMLPVLTQRAPSVVPVSQDILEMEHTVQTLMSGGWMRDAC